MDSRAPCRGALLVVRTAEEAAGFQRATGKGTLEEGHYIVGTVDGGPRLIANTLERTGVDCDAGALDRRWRGGHLHRRKPPPYSGPFSAPGDSGAPVFLSNTARGILSGGNTDLVTATRCARQQPRRGKMRPYEEPIRVPLLVRGPSVAADCTTGDTSGRTTYKLALNTDYLPTFTDLAGLGEQMPSYVPDGRSLQPVLKGSVSSWRSAILLEGAQNGNAPVYYGIRTVGADRQKYVEYEGTPVRELYYLGTDPYELINKYNSAAPPTTLASRLQVLKRCAGNDPNQENSCRTAEGP